MIAKGHYSEAERQQIVSLLHSGHNSKKLADEYGITPETIMAWDEEIRSRHELDDIYATAITSKDNLTNAPLKGNILLSFLKRYGPLSPALLIIVSCVIIFIASFNKVTHRVSLMSQNTLEQQIDSISSIIGCIEVRLCEIDRNVEDRNQYSVIMSKTLSVLSDDIKQMRKSNIYWNKRHYQCCNCQEEDSITNYK